MVYDLNIWFEGNCKLTSRIAIISIFTHQEVYKYITDSLLIDRWRTVAIQFTKPETEETCSNWSIPRDSLKVEYFTCFWTSLANFRSLCCELVYRKVRLTVLAWLVAVLCFLYLNGGTSRLPSITITKEGFPYLPCLASLLGRLQWWWNVFFLIISHSVSMDYRFHTINAQTVFQENTKKTVQCFYFKI